MTMPTRASRDRDNFHARVFKAISLSETSIKSTHISGLPMGRQRVLRSDQSGRLVCEPRRHFRRSFFAWKITSAETSGNSISTNQNVAPKNCELTRAILFGNAWDIRGIFTRQKNANDNNNSRNIYL